MTHNPYLEDRPNWMLYLVITGVLGLLVAVWFLSTSKPTEDDQSDPAETEIRKEDSNDSSDKSLDSDEESSLLSMDERLKEARRRLDELGMSAATLSADSTLVLGRVLISVPDSDPEPAANAEVMVYRIGADGIVDSAANLTTTTSGTGHYVFTMEEGWGYELRAAAPACGQATATIDKSQLSPPLLEMSDLILSPLSILKITVTTGNAQLGESVEPVPGMTLQLREDKETDPIASGTTDKSGVLELTDINPGSWLLEGELSPYAMLAQPISLSKPEETLELNVDIVGALRLKVTSPGGAPLKQYAVALDFRHDTYAYRPPQFEDIEVEDDEGWYLITNIKAGRNDLFVSAAGFALGTKEQVEIRAGETTDVVMALPLGHRVRGRVLRKADQTPIADAIVFSERDLIPSVVNLDDPSEYRAMAKAAKCGTNGRFVLDDLTEGKHQFTAIHPDFAAKASKSVNVTPDGQVEVIIELSGGARVYGHVYDDVGAPASGLQVIAVPIMDRNMRKKGPVIATTDDHGYYSLEHLTPGFMGIICINTPGSNSEPYTMKMNPLKEGQELEVNFGDPAKGATVRGRVTTADGKPATHLMVMLMGSEDTESTGIPKFYQGAADSAGDYEILGVPEGHYIAALALTQRGSSFTVVGDLSVPDGGIVEKDFQAEGVRVSATIVDKSTSQPLTEGAATLMRGGQTEFAGRMDILPGGRVEFINVAPGTYFLHLMGTGYAERWIENVQVTEESDKELGTLELEPGGDLHGTVTDAQSQAVSGATVLFKNPTTSIVIPAMAFPTNEDGMFQVTSLAPGEHILVIQKAGLTFPETTVSITAGQTTTTTVQAE